MKFYLCIDDTDNLDSIGTGTIAEQILEKIISSGFGPCSLVTRHQLYIHEDIPYTSHNSSMCFYGEAPEDSLSTIIELASHHLDTVAAVGSDPGLCVLKYHARGDYTDLIAFGKAAKKIVLTKDDAIKCAQTYGIHLSEHGGTGQGIIGALAGVGLRIFSNDGEIKGALKHIDVNRNYSVAELMTLPEVDQVLDLQTKEQLTSDAIINMSSRSKTVLYQNDYVLFVAKKDNGAYESLNKAKIRELGENFYV
ncbi:MAG: hypothetical protein ACOH15_04350 [Acetobacterium sp.]